MKGITPIISTIILLLITVALAGVAYSYLAGYMNIQTEKSFMIPAGGFWCDAGGKFHVRVLNTGTATINTNDLAITVEGQFGTAFATKTITSGIVNIKSPAVFTSASADLGSAGQTYTVRVAAGASVQSQVATCP